MDNLQYISHSFILWCKNVQKLANVKSHNINLPDNITRQDLREQHTYSAVTYNPLIIKINSNTEILYLKNTV